MISVEKIERRRKTILLGNLSFGFSGITSTRENNNYQENRKYGIYEYRCENNGVRVSPETSSSIRSTRNVVIREIDFEKEINKKQSTLR